MTELSLYNVRKILSLDEQKLDQYLQENKFTNCITKYFIFSNMYNINEPCISVLHNHGWFNDELLEYILNKKNYFLIIYMNQEYDFYTVKEALDFKSINYE